MPATVVGTVPVDRPMPALSNRTTSRFDASGSVTAGSQLSSVPVKCWRQISGRLIPPPRRRYAYVPRRPCRNWVAAVVLLSVVVTDISRLLVGVLRPAAPAQANRVAATLSV